MSGLSSLRARLKRLQLKSSDPGLEIDALLDELPLEVLFEIVAVGEPSRDRPAGRLDALFRDLDCPGDSEIELATKVVRQLVRESRA